MSVVIPFKRPEKPQVKPIARNGISGQVTAPIGVDAIGIDLGTTHSVVSHFDPKSTHPVSLQYQNDTLVPSVLYYNPHTHEVLIGKVALQKGELDIENVVRSTKRHMGLADKTFQSTQKNFSPEDVATKVLEYLTKHPSLQIQREKFGSVYAVITVPAHFDDAARQATLAAATEANIKVLRVINEPTAAALAYSMLPDVRHVEKEILAVYDFGGGTFDISIVEREGLVFNVLSSEGDVKLGGDDIDVAFADYLLQFVEPPFVARRATRESQLFKNLIHVAEQAKKDFAQNAQVNIQNNQLDSNGSRIATSVERETFYGLAAPLIQRTLELTERAMLAAKKRPSQVSRILTVGGSSRLGLVEQMLAAYFPNSMVDGRLEPDLAISWGASIQAAIILGLQPETILVDVCSHTLGIGVAEDKNAVNHNFKLVAEKYNLKDVSSDEAIQEELGDKLADFNRDLQALLNVAPIIHRNAPLPARRAEFFSTLYPNQPAVQVIVTQGEEFIVGKNKLIGAFLFDLEQPCPAGTRCEIQLTYDVNGMVQVSAKQIGTDNEAVAQFDSRTGEVMGWQKLEPKTTIPASLHPTSEATISQALTSEVSTAPTSTSSEPPVMNAVIVKARRALMTLAPESPQRIKIQKSLEDYTAALEAARHGTENDTRVETLEDELLELILDEPAQ